MHTAADRSQIVKRNCAAVAEVNEKSETLGEYQFRIVLSSPRLEELGSKKLRVTVEPRTNKREKKVEPFSRDRTRTPCFSTERQRDNLE